jgi:hypothetical protein
MEFLPITVDSFLELTASATRWVELGILTGPEALEIARLDKYREAALAREDEKRKKRFLMNPDTAVAEAQPDTPGISAPTAGLPGVGKSLNDLVNQSGPPLSKQMPRGGSVSSLDAEEQALRVELLKKKIKATEDFDNAVNELRRLA